MIVSVSSLSILSFLFSTFPILSGREESTSGQLFVVKFGKSKQNKNGRNIFFIQKIFAYSFAPQSKFAFVHHEPLTKTRFFLDR
jgi:hypothetical protein